MFKCLECSMVFEDKAFLCPRCGFEPHVSHGITLFAPDFDKNLAGFSVEAFENLYKSEENSFWFRSRNRLILWALSRFFSSSESIMEIGCGTGFVLNAIAKANTRKDLKLVGSELFPEGLLFAQSRLNSRVQLMQMDARKIPFESEYDVVCAFDVIEHIREDDEVLTSIQQALKPGGGIIVTVPQHAWLWSSVDEHAHHERRYSRRDLVAKMAKAGFRCIYFTSFVSVLLPIMVISRLRKNRFSNESTELSLPKWLDLIFEDFMNVELSIIKHGVRFPIGGSLLVVGIKA